jgi:hypothetical protein
VDQGESEELEWKTRRNRIDPRLRALGWKIVPFKPELEITQHVVTEFPTANEPADYALLVNGRIVGIIEAKKLSLGWPTERFDSSGALCARSGSRRKRTPFLYSTNGEVIWFHDVRHPASRSRTLANFSYAGRIARAAGPRFRRGLPSKIAPLDLFGSTRVSSHILRVKLRFSARCPHETVSANTASRTFPRRRLLALRNPMLWCHDALLAKDSVVVQ